MPQRRATRVKNPCHPRAFTLIELLTVIIIIAILIGILLPVISKVRQSAYAADTKNEIASIQNAIERYYQVFQAYPGPLSNAQIYNSGGAPTITEANAPATPKWDLSKITMSENLTLGLLGGLKFDSSSGTYVYDSTLIGKGPQSLNSANPRGYSAYLDNTNLSSGAFKDDAGSANDTDIPEFVDRYPHPLPILYLRANVGASGVVTNTITTASQAQYDLTQILGYTSSLIGRATTTNKHGLSDLTTIPSGTIDPYEYFASLSDPEWNVTPIVPTAFATPKQKDGYILISAGADRKYGTTDDIVSFGAIKP